MDKLSLPLNRMVPSRITLEAFFRSIQLVGKTYQKDFGWDSTPITVACGIASFVVNVASNQSYESLAKEMDLFFEELVLALPPAVRCRDHIESGTALAHLCFLSSLELQTEILKGLRKQAVLKRPLLSGWESRMCYELVALWRLVPWYVSAINAAMPVMDFPISDQTEEKEDVKSDSRSLLEPSA